MRFLVDEGCDVRKKIIRRLAMGWPIVNSGRYKYEKFNVDYGIVSGGILSGWLLKEQGTQSG
jgi:hypothetical protein